MNLTKAEIKQMQLARRKIRREQREARAEEKRQREMERLKKRTELFNLQTLEREAKAKRRKASQSYVPKRRRRKSSHVGYGGWV